MSERLASGHLAFNNLIRIIIVAAVLIIAAVIVFETKPTSQARGAAICNNCSYYVSEKPSYLDKLLDPISLFTLALVISTGLLWAATERLARLAETQSNDMRDSINESARAATAMEQVSGYLKINADEIIKSVEISQRLATQQKLIGELQTRAYVAVNYIGTVLQNNETGYRFEPRLQIVGTGITPAYKVCHRSASDVLDYPLPEDFDFPLAIEEKHPSIGTLGPRNTFIISAITPRLYAPDEIEELMSGVKKRIFVWGIITYEDAFQTPRYLKFCQSIIWMADRQTSLGFNDPRHNDAN